MNPLLSKKQLRQDAVRNAAIDYANLTLSFGEYSQLKEVTIVGAEKDLRLGSYANRFGKHDMLDLDTP